MKLLFLMMTLAAPESAAAGSAFADGQMYFSPAINHTKTLIGENQKTTSHIDFDAGSNLVENLVLFATVRHPRFRDISISLEGPDGRTAQIIPAGKAGGPNLGINRIVSVFGGGKSRASGTWTLVVHDRGRGAQGRIQTWGLAFSTRSAGQLAEAPRFELGPALVSCIGNSDCGDAEFCNIAPEDEFGICEPGRSAGPAPEVRLGDAIAVCDSDEDCPDRQICLRDPDDSAEAFGLCAAPPRP